MNRLFLPTLTVVSQHLSIQGRLSLIIISVTAVDENGQIGVSGWEGSTTIASDAATGLNSRLLTLLQSVSELELIIVCCGYSARYCSHFRTNCRRFFTCFLDP